MNFYRAQLNDDNNIKGKCCLGGFDMKVCLTTIKKLFIDPNSTLRFIWLCFYTLHSTSTCISKALSKKIRSLCSYFEMIQAF